MNDKPALYIQFDPITWQIISICFQASTDRETKKLIELFARGISYDDAATNQGTYHA